MGITFGPMYPGWPGNPGLPLNPCVGENKIYLSLNLTTLQGRVSQDLLIRAHVFRIVSI